MSQIGTGSLLRLGEVSFYIGGHNVLCIYEFGEHFDDCQMRGGLRGTGEKGIK